MVLRLVLLQQKVSLRKWQFYIKLQINYVTVCIDVDFKIISDAYVKILSNVSIIQELAKSIKHIENLFVIGRGIHYPIAKEAALKIKEITYVHAEGNCRR